MPHQCTECSRTFDDGSKEMLSGCPNCGGNKFQFQPDGVDQSAAEEPPEPAVDNSVARTVGNAATAVRDFVGSDSSARAPPEDDISPQRDSTPEMSTPGETTARMADSENSAQASARSEVVSTDDLPPSPEQPAENQEAVATPVADSSADREEETEDRPDLSQLRDELNDQFESIRVLEPGQYELNLMELYNREEYIIALQEDGKYTIQVPERWKND